MEIARLYTQPFNSYNGQNIFFIGMLKMKSRSWSWLGLWSLGLGLETLVLVLVLLTKSWSWSCHKSLADITALPQDPQKPNAASSGWIIFCINLNCILRNCMEVFSNTPFVHGYGTFCASCALHQYSYSIWINIGLCFGRQPIGCHHNSFHENKTIEDEYDYHPESKHYVLSAWK